MANTTKIGTRSIEITGLDADWWGDTELAGKPAIEQQIRAITFIPSLATDRFIIHDGGLDSATIFDTGICSDRGARVKEYKSPLNMSLVIDISDCIMDDDSAAKIVIELE